MNLKLYFVKEQSDVPNRNKRNLSSICFVRVENEILSMSRWTFLVILWFIIIHLFYEGVGPSLLHPRLSKLVADLLS